jgi:hypothetical protein
MARRFGIDVRALVPIAIPDPVSVGQALSNEAIAGYLWETLSYFGCDERVEKTIKDTASEEGFNALTYDAFVRRVERALEEAGFEVAKRNVKGRAMYADSHARRYTDMELHVVGPDRAVTVFHAHKCVMSSASSFLKAMIEQSHTNMIGSDGPYEVYEILEIPVDVFRVCMEFMYTGEVHLDVPLGSDLVAGLVLAADRLFIADGLFQLIGRELVNEENAPRAIEAAYMTHATDATRGLVDMCAVYIVRSLARNGDGMEGNPIAGLQIRLPPGAIYAIAGEVINEQAAQISQSPGQAYSGEIDALMLSVGAAVLACTGTETRNLLAHLIATGTPTNEHAGNYRATFASIDTTGAPVYWGQFRMSTVPYDGKYTFVFHIGQGEYVACVRKSNPSKTPGSVRITVVFRSSEPAQAPQLVTIRAAGRSVHAVLTCGYQHNLDVPCSELENGVIISVEVEVDPLFAICSEVIRATVQQGGPRAVALVAGLDTRVLVWILNTESRRVSSYEAILREVAIRPSKDDRVELTKALISGFGISGVSMSDITALLSSLPCLFEADNEVILDMLVSYSVGLAGDESVRDQLTGLIKCMSQGIRNATAMTAMRI